MKKLYTSAFALAVFASPLMALAEEGVKRGDEVTKGAAAAAGSYFIAKAIAIGLAAFGGAIGQGMLAAAALEGIARNPGAYNNIFTPMILGIAFVESLVIFALIIAFTM